METERGRWFLAEFARRNRAADTQAVLEALAAIEARLADRPMVLRQETETPVEEAPVEEAVSEEPPIERAMDAETVQRIAAAAQLTESLRAELSASNRQGRFVLRTAAQVEEIGRELTLALQALRPGAARAAEPTEDTAEAETITTAPSLGPDAVEDARAAAGERRLAELYEELARPIVIEALEAPDTIAAMPLSQEAAPELARSRGERDALAIAAPRREIEAGGAPHDHRRGALPRAWTPPLLDSLSDAEKAMLFA